MKKSNSILFLTVEKEVPPLVPHQGAEEPTSENSFEETPKKAKAF